jgi:hypothetical protein
MIHEQRRCAPSKDFAGHLREIEQHPSRVVSDHDRLLDHRDTAPDALNDDRVTPAAAVRKMRRLPRP